MFRKRSVRKLRQHMYICQKKETRTLLLNILMFQYNIFYCQAYLISHASFIFQIFRMSETLECYILLQFIVYILSLLSVLIQLIVIRVPSWDRVAKITVLTFSIISTAKFRCTILNKEQWCAERCRQYFWALRYWRRLHLCTVYMLI